MKSKTTATTHKETPKKDIAVDVMDENLDDETLPVKNSFRISETAAYFEVVEATIRNWIDHGHLQAERVGGGTIMITRRSILKCRFGKKVLPRIF